MRYDRIGMGGGGGGLVMLIFIGIGLFTILAWATNRWPKAVESILEAGFSLGSLFISLALNALLATVIFVPVSGILELDASGARIAWLVIFGALLAYGYVKG